MNIQKIKNVITSKAGRQLIRTKKNAPTIMFAAGVAGVVGSAVLACKATLRLEDILNESDNLKDQIDRSQGLVNYTDKDREHDLRVIRFRLIRDVGKLYAPAASVGVISIAALTGSHIALNRRNTALMAAYAALDRGFKEYRQRVVEEYGEDQDLQFRFGSETRQEAIVGDDGEAKMVEHRGIKLEGMPSIYARYFDRDSNVWSPQQEYNRAYLKAQQEYTNHLLTARGHVFLNEVYDNLGLERSKAGAVVGWVKNNGDDYVDFGIFDASDRFRMELIDEDGGYLLDFNVDGVIYNLLED